MAALAKDLTNPNRFTSTYNDSYRDGNMFISPHASQPMCHYSDRYDPSHFDGFQTKDGFSRSSLPPIPFVTNMQLTAEKQASRSNSNTPKFADNPMPMHNGGDPTAPGATGYGFPPSTHAAATRADVGRSKSHVPGYQGFVRGEQFRYGETYGRVTRRCLDVPTCLPLEP